MPRRKYQKHRLEQKIVCYNLSLDKSLTIKQISLILKIPYSTACWIIRIERIKHQTQIKLI
jgi:hypothetical protein